MVNSGLVARVYMSMIFLFVMAITMTFLNPVTVILITAAIPID